METFILSNMLISSIFYYYSYMLVTDTSIHEKKLPPNGVVFRIFYWLWFNILCLCLRFSIIFTIDKKNFTVYSADYMIFIYYLFYYLFECSLPT